MISGLKSSRWVGDFQVATGGGFWVATWGNGGTKLQLRRWPKRMHEQMDLI